MNHEDVLATFVPASELIGSSAPLTATALGEILADFLRSRDIAVFAGAGISYHSGLPLALPLSEEILRALPLSDAQVRHVIECGLPFESLVEAVSEVGKLSLLLPVFKGGFPCGSHLLLAQLIRQGYLNRVCTTNFDCLIESALERLGLNNGEHYRALCSEEELGGGDSWGAEPLLLKVHGSVSKPETIAITLRAVSSNRLSGPREGVIREIFSDGKASRVLVLGYSCSDAFDLVPAMEGIRDSYKDILFIQHRPGGSLVEVEPIQRDTKKNPFRHYRFGLKLTADTDEVLRSVAGKLGVDIDTGPARQYNWREIIDAWARDMDENLSPAARNIAAGTVLLRASDLHGAEESYGAALSAAHSTGDAHVAVTALANLSNVYRQTGRMREAIAVRGSVISMLREIGDLENLSGQLIAQGIERVATHHYEEATELLEEALQYARHLGDQYVEASALVHLGVPHFRLGHLDQAVELLQQGLEIARSAGYPQGVALAQSNLGNIELARKNYARAREYYTAGLQAAQRIRDRKGEMQVLGNLGASHLNESDWKAGIAHTEAAISIAQELKLAAEEQSFQLNLGHGYARAGVDEAASACFQAAYELALSRADFSNWIYFEAASAQPKQSGIEGRVAHFKDRLSATSFRERPREYLRLVHLMANLCEAVDLDLAWMYFQEGLATAQKIKEPRAIVVFLRNIGNCEGKAGKHEIAEAMHRRALGEAERIGYHPEISLAHHNIGTSLLMRGAFDDACRHFEACAEMARQDGATRLEARALGDQGACHLNMHRYDRCILLTREALKLLSGLPAIEAESLIRTYRANIEMAERLSVGAEDAS